MNIEDIKEQVRTDQYYYSAHAEIERKADELTFAQVEEAILKSTILEQYPGYWTWRKLFASWIFRGYTGSYSLWLAW